MHLVGLFIELVTMHGTYNVKNNYLWNYNGFF